MHYKNGREAKNGDKVVMINYGRMFTGVLYDAQAGNDCCNGNLAPLAAATYANLAECLHMDDAVAALPASVPDTSKPSELAPVPEPSSEPKAG